MLRLNELLGEVARNLKGLLDSAPLHVIRGREVDAFGQLLDVQIDDVFHITSVLASGNVA